MDGPDHADTTRAALALGALGVVFSMEGQPRD
jgi:hypothetical protein